MMEIVSFDLDGTLVDTAAEIAEAVNRTLARHALPPQPRGEIVRRIGSGLRPLLDGLLQTLTEGDPQGLQGLDRERLWRSLQQHADDLTGTLAQPYPGAVTCLAALAADGVRLACVTNKESRLAERVLRAHGLREHFDLLVGGDTLPVRKPAPGVLWHVAAHFQVPVQRLAHVGDSEVDVLAARHAGVAAWAVPYGYNAGRPVQDARPDRVFEDLRAVASHVLALRRTGRT